MLDQGHPRDALKMLRFAQIKSWNIPPGHDRRMVESCAQAGESDRVAMAHRAITDVSKLSSVQARTRLRPLAAALAR